MPSLLANKTGKNIYIKRMQCASFVYMFTTEPETQRFFKVKKMMRGE